MYGNAILHSVDGDFIPIALMEYERQVRELHEHPSDATARQPAKMAIYRLQCKLAGDHPSAAKKRDVTGAAKEVQKRQRYQNCL
jgi:hypothetical protein